MPTVTDANVAPRPASAAANFLGRVDEPRCDNKRRRKAIEPIAEALGYGLETGRRSPLCVSPTTTWWVRCTRC